MLIRKTRSTLSVSLSWGAIWLISSPSSIKPVREPFTNQGWTPGRFSGFGRRVECEAVYAVAKTRGVVNTEKAGVIDVDKVKVGYSVIAAELFKQGSGIDKQFVMVTCEPGVLNIRGLSFTKWVVSPMSWASAKRSWLK